MAVVQWNPTMPWRPFQQPWSPFEGIESLRHEMDRLFDPFAGSTPPSGIRESAWIPRVDLLEHENAFVLVADLPGMQQADINVSVQDNVLTLAGKRTLEPVENGQGTYHYSERASGTCCRRFLLSTAVNAAQITATYKQGVLEVHLPKAVEAQPKRIAVQAST
jgi:HSP20 family protein